MPVQYAWLIPFVPFLASVLLLFFTRKNKQLSSWISIGAVVYALLHSICLLFKINPENIIQNDWIWLKAGALSLKVGILLDPLAVTMLIVVCTVSLFVQIYSTAYMKGDEGYSKFFVFLSMFTASMLALVISPNLFQLYIFWELVGLCSYLLIGFWHHKKEASDAAFKAFVVNRIGDCGLLIGILFLVFLSKSFWSTGNFLNFTELSTVVTALKNQVGVSETVLSILGILLFMGAMAKSAQFPLHTWLPDAMEGPTPISALIHSATMVAAGIFLLIRLHPIFEASVFASSFVLFIGLVTTLAAAFIALTQRDIKRVLAYSTCSQLGIMTMAAGAGLWVPALFHLITHAFFKSLLFLGSGSVIHGTNEQDIFKMGNLKEKMPVTHITFLIGCLSLSGIPLLAGFWSKEAILTKIINQNEMMHYVYFALFAIICLLTAFYSFRLYFLTFHGKYRGSNEEHVHESPKAIIYPLIFFAFMTVIIGFLNTPLSIFGGENLQEYLAITEVHSHLLSILEYLKTEFFTFINLTFLSVALLAIFITKKKYSKSIESYEIKNPRSFLFILSERKLFIDEFFNLVIQKIFLPVCKISWVVLDKYILNKGILAFLNWNLNTKAKIYSKIFQSGNFQTYTLITIISFLLLFLLTFQGQTENAFKLDSEIQKLQKINQQIQAMMSQQKQ